MESKQEGKTQTGKLRSVARRSLPAKVAEKPVVTWREQVKTKWGEELLKNMAVAAALVICAVVLRSGSATAPLTDAVLTAVTGDTLLDDGLGKLTFVSTLFPEATLVFGEGTLEKLASPVLSRAVVHAWSEAEPYVSFAGAEEVYAACPGEVMGVYHGEAEELLVTVRRADGLECSYGNLGAAAVATGDEVLTGARLGTCLAGKEATFEVRRDGYSIDPTALMEAEP